MHALLHISLSHILTCNRIKSPTLKGGNKEADSPHSREVISSGLTESREVMCRLKRVNYWSLGTKLNRLTFGTAHTFKGACTCGMLEYRRRIVSRFNSHCINKLGWVTVSTYMFSALPLVVFTVENLKKKSEIGNLRTGEKTLPPPPLPRSVSPSLPSLIFLKKKCCIWDEDIAV